MINTIIVLAFLIGGLKLMTETRKNHNFYIATGFILYAISQILDPLIVQGTIIEIIFEMPRVLAALCLMISPILYLKGESK